MLRSDRRRAIPFFAAALLALPVAGFAEEDWCGESRDHDTHCEVRELEVSPRTTLRVDARPNGGISVAGWSDEGIRLRVKVTARGADAEELARQVEIVTDDTIHAVGPKGDRNRHWSVSYRLSVPREKDLDLRSTNGGISIRSVKGHLEFETRNGGVNLEDVGGEVRGRTTNGGLKVSLSGDRWDGSGLDVRTTNGGVVLAVPRGYNAELETGTVNGGIKLDFPVEVSGRLKNKLQTTLGEGGAPLRIRTTNGGVRLKYSS